MKREKIVEAIYIYIYIYTYSWLFNPGLATGGLTITADSEIRPRPRSGTADDRLSRNAICLSVAAAARGKGAHNHIAGREHCAHANENSCALARDSRM